MIVPGDLLLSTLASIAIGGTIGFVGSAIIRNTICRNVSSKEWNWGLNIAFGLAAVILLVWGISLMRVV